MSKKTFTTHEVEQLPYRQKELYTQMNSNNALLHRISKRSCRDILRVVNSTFRSLVLKRLEIDRDLVKERKAP